jgi:hypothetical protein
MTDEELKVLTESRPGSLGAEAGGEWARHHATLYELGLLGAMAECAIIHPEQVAQQTDVASNGQTYWRSALSAVGKAHKAADQAFVRGFAAGALMARNNAIDALRHQQAEEARRKPYDEALKRFMESRAG